MNICVVTAMPIRSLVSSSKEINTSGGWVSLLVEYLAKECNVTVLSICNQSELFEEIENVVFHGISSKNGKFKFDRKVLDSIDQLDLDHIDLFDVQGAEFELYNYIDKIALQNQRLVLTLQGITLDISRRYCSDIPLKHLVFGNSIIDVLRGSTYLGRQKAYFRRSVNELNIIKKCHFVIGRTEYDHTFSKVIQPNIAYHHVDRFIRDSFFEKYWFIPEKENNNYFTILTTQATYPIKGLHFLLEAIYYLKLNHPDKEFRLVITGKNIYSSSIKNRLTINSYDKYLKKLIKKYDLHDNIEFVGWKNGEEMADLLSKVDCFILPSSVENSSNSLAEAQIVGCPVIAARVGGNETYIEHEVSGLLYRSNDVLSLTMSIESFMSLSVESLTELTENERKRARARHDREANLKTLISVYRKIIGDQ